MIYVYFINILRNLFKEIILFVLINKRYNCIRYLFLSNNIISEEKKILLRLIKLISDISLMFIIYTRYM